MMGARDLSIINTPPPNRHPINTELHTFNEDIIREAINYEVERSGQVFFINNRVQNIADVEALINRICPEVKTIVAHGQMDGTKLESIILDFMAGDYDVLIATTIIEARPRLLRLDDNLTIPLTFSFIMFIFNLIWVYNY